MNYSDNSGSVRVDFFKPSGKWYMTEAWDMSDYYNYPIGPQDAVIAMLMDSDRGRELRKGLTVVVTEPYHKYTYPVLIQATNPEESE